MPPLVQVENLSKEFGAVRALDQVTLSVDAGEWRSEEHTSESSHIQKSRMPSSA